ncbi:transglycosylase domain-containing protein [Streptomyces sp. NBC_01304]|uniref:transglycosylase domain-containing protein n=1 Tax=Streptomyces sp. NBC_01304 TaxID=2903818 RepID=UPI002E10C699|nr:penicillin-binding protein [Streptomyces sp. NBC_01304]
MAQRSHARAGRRKRRIDYPRRGRTGWRRWLPSWRLQLGTFAFFVLTLTGLFVAVYVSVDIPDENAEARQEASVYYWSDGSPMVSVGAVNRQNVTLDEISDSLESAVIAAENESFYSDSGVSPKGIARAAVSIATGEETQGGSTITQQYVKNTHLSQEQTVTRKAREFVIALKLSNQKSKQEILQGYLNTSWFGRGSYGIQAAAYTYYGIPASKLDPSQSALLAALLKGAEEYDPGLSAANHKRAEERWEWILDRQVATGALSKEKRDRYRTFPEPKKPAKPTSQAGQTGYLLDIANKYIKARTGLTDKEIAHGGYRIHTTFDKKKVQELTKAVEQVRKKNIDPKKRAKTDTYVEVGAASVRPEDGAVVAAYGGSDAVKHFTNNADTSGVPVGSAFKPFVLAADLAHQGPKPDDFPRAGAVRTPLSAMDLTAAPNSAFREAGLRAGLANVRRTAISAGLREGSLAELEPTFSLGTSTPSAIRMAHAYGTFANDGKRAEPYSVTRVLLDDQPLPGFDKPTVRRVLTPEVAGNVNSALGTTAWKTLAPRTAERLAPVAAGGTGAGDRMKSAWFIGTASMGTTDELTTAVAMFRSKPGTPQLLPMQGVGGSGSERGNAFPQQIWSAYATAISDGDAQLARKD